VDATEQPFPVDAALHSVATVKYACQCLWAQRWDLHDDPGVPAAERKYLLYMNVGHTA